MGVLGARQAGDVLPAGARARLTRAQKHPECLGPSFANMGLQTVLLADGQLFHITADGSTKPVKLASAAARRCEDSPCATEALPPRSHAALIEHTGRLYVVGGMDVASDAWLLQLTPPCVSCRSRAPS